MKLFCLNVEGKKHYDRWHKLLSKHQPDVICLMEAPEDIVTYLEALQYHVTYAPLCIRDTEAKYTEGLILASKVPHKADVFYYHKFYPEIVPYNPEDKQRSVARSLIFASIGDTNIATTHFTWAERGEIASDDQTEDLEKVLNYLNEKPPHFLCGDFNIPRNVNHLYHALENSYTDLIPPHHTSSLDKDLHRLGDQSEYEKLFNQFMVDYLLAKSPLTATDVQLHFGVSDHAAITATLVQK